VSEQGIVRWYSIAKGYGFIRRAREATSSQGTSNLEDLTPSSDQAGSQPDPAEQTDIFVHYSDVAGEPLSEGERVCFEVVSSPKGPKARNVTLATDC